MNTSSLFRAAFFFASLAFCNLAMAQVKVVYHINEGVAQAYRAMGNIRNHLAADPTAKITVVTHGPGIDFLLDGATNAIGESFAGSIGDLASKGVEFKVCNNTLVTRKIPKDHGSLCGSLRCCGSCVTSGTFWFCLPSPLNSIQSKFIFH
jgi:intracellular sulfur oxidation DsrE/DsrF family protein